nr:MULTISPECIES: AAA family ATPase [Anaerotruncus]
MNEHVETVVVEEVSNDDSEIDRLTTGENVLLYGVPGSGKSWTIEHEYCKPGSVVERLVFHPDYTYSDFIGQILPAVAEDGQVSYKFTPGPFTNILREAYQNPGTEYILIIEEINRGNAPAIFGEVFQLLDRKVEICDIDDGYPIGTSEYGITNMSIAEEMYGKDRKTEKVRIPSNLSIIGTMNTSDQNVFTLDTAFQRRWDMRLIENDFENVDPTLANAEILDTTVTWRNFCVEINKVVVGNSARMTSAEDKRLGAYFVHLRDLKFNDEMGDLKEYDTLRKEESKGTLTPEEKTQIAVIRDAMRQNRKFPEKVIKYLWDDAFKFNREVIFEVTEYQSLEQVIHAFMYAKGLDRFKVFKDNVKSAFTGAEEE